MKINRVIVKNTNLPPSINEFFKKFAECIIASLIDFFSGYNQINLNKKNRDLTAFHTPIGLLKMTTCTQKAINSVIQFARITTKILQEYISRLYFSFFDDISVKGPKTRYDDARILSNIRKFVLEH